MIGGISYSTFSSGHFWYLSAAFLTTFGHLHTTGSVNTEGYTLATVPAFIDLGHMFFSNSKFSLWVVSSCVAFRVSAKGLVRGVC